MPKNPYNNLLLDQFDEFEFFLIFWVQILSCLPLLQEGITAGFPALGSSHSRPCIKSMPRPLIHQGQLSKTVFLHISLAIEAQKAC